MSGSEAPPPRGPGRRVAPPRRRAESRSRAGAGGSGWLAVGLVVLAVVLVALTPTVDPPARPATVTGQLVDRTVLACPATDAQLRTDAGIGVATADGPLEDLGSAGTVRVGEPGRAGEPLEVSRGELVRLRDGGAPVVDARGAVAAGLFASRSDRADGNTADRAVTRCASPRASWWFVGAGATLDHSAELSMTNVDPAPAVVDVRVFAPTGEVDTIGTRGLTVAPGERVEIPLADIAPQRDDLLVHVQASRGRVVAAVLDEYAPRPGADQGLAWLPSTDRPSRRVRLAGIQGGARDHTLLVGNPSDLEALVELEVSGESGSFTPAGTEDLSVPPGSVAAVELDLGGEAVALRLRSRVPVVAAVRSTQGDDTSYAGAVTPLRGPAAVPVERGRTTLQLTAGAVASAVRLTGRDRNGDPTGEDLFELDPTATGTWQPPEGSAYVVVQPVQGSVYGAATYTRPGLAQSALVTLPVRVRQPHVRPGP